MKREGYRHLNLLIPMKMYEELRKYNIKTRKSFAEIVRGAISLLLEQMDENRKGNGKSIHD